MTQQPRKRKPQKHGRNRPLVVRAVRREPIDTERFAHALLALAAEQLAADKIKKKPAA